jgi:large subunit ribosomal protein L11
MAISSVEVLVEGGKATAAPPLGPALGPLGVNIGMVVAEINKKTVDFKGMQVPVKVSVDSDTKAFTISIGTPPASGLIKKEAKVEKGSGVPNKDLVGDLKIEQIIKIAKMKEDALSGKNLKERVKEIIGTCRSMGIKVEEKEAAEAIEMVNAGKFDKEISSGKTEITAEELKQIEEERKKLQKEVEEKRAQYEAAAKAIMKTLEGKTVEEIRKALDQAKIPEIIINKLAPKSADKKGGAAKGGAAKGGAAKGGGKGK